MKLAEALVLTAAAGEGEGRFFKTYLACGFTPLHLKTFLCAQIYLRRPDRRVVCEAGPYGNLAISVDPKRAKDADAAAILIEWADLDPRLGHRALGGWTIADLEDILAVSGRRLILLGERIGTISARQPTAVSLPSLPLPPAFHTSGWQASKAELQLRGLVSNFAVELAEMQGVSVVSAQYIDLNSPFSERMDIKSELNSGFPYSRAHANALAKALAKCLAPATPAKALITDLDDTLWRGLIGEVGIDGLSWGMDGRGQIHGLYQQLLNSLAENGVLLGVASKNDPAVVSMGLASPGLVTSGSQFFPVIAGWNPKSEMIKTILKTWNIGADAVVFVDDSPMEVAEVQERFPAMQCRIFPAQDEATAERLFHELRGLFGKSLVTEEDRLRAESIRKYTLLPEVDEGHSLDEFLASAESELEISFAKQPFDPRAFELTNKTNQFNLNGDRFDEREWRSMLDCPDSFLMVVSYADKFGKLGKIGVAFGHWGAGEFTIEGWVLSCRAFSRRIEHCMLATLFNRFSANVARLNFAPTPKNSPIVEFIEPLADRLDVSPATITRAHFHANQPTLFHKVVMHE